MSYICKNVSLSISSAATRKATAGLLAMMVGFLSASPRRWYLYSTLSISGCGFAQSSHRHRKFNSCFICFCLIWVDPRACV
ncbi:hypothetical protein BDV06DRAFT_195191 [Aspergillus oleicola]